MKAYKVLKNEIWRELERILRLKQLTMSDFDF